MPLGRPRVFTDAQLDAAAELAWQGVPWPGIHERVAPDRGTWNGLYKATHARRHLPPIGGNAEASDRADDAAARVLDRPSYARLLRLRCEPECARRLWAG